MRVIAALVLALTLRGADPVMDAYNRAWLMVGQRRLDQAIEQLKTLIEQYPRFYRGCDLLVRAHELKKDQTAGAAFFQKLLEREPNSAIAHYGLGRSAAEQQHYSEALEHYTACVQADPMAAVCQLALPNELRRATKSAATAADLRRRLPATVPNSSCIARMYFSTATNNQAAAIAESDACIQAMRTSGDPGALWWALHETISAYSLDRQFDHVLALAIRQRELAESIGDRQRTIEAMESVAQGESYLGDLAAARTLEEEILRMGRELQHRDVVSAALFDLARYAGAQGEHDQALAYIQERRGMNIEGGDLPALAQTLQTLGAIQSRRGDLESALQAFRDQLAAERKLRSLTGQAFALRSIAVIEGELGNYFGAIRDGLESVRMFKDQGDSWRAGAGISNVGDVYWALGDTATAIRYMQESLQSGIAHHDSAEQERNLDSLAAIHLATGEPTRALGEAREALRVSREPPNSSILIDTRLTLADALRHLHRDAEAMQRLDEVLGICEQTGRFVEMSDALHLYGDIYFAEKNYRMAGDYYRRSLEAAKNSGVVDLIIQARRGLASALRAEGDLPAAHELLEAAIRSIESLRQGAPTAELRAGFVRNNAETYEDMLDVLFELNRADRLARRTREALTYAERGRASAFRDQLAEANIDIHEGISSEDRQREGRLKKELSDASGRLLGAPTEANRRAADRAEQKLAEWVVDQRTRNPRYQELKYPEAFDADRVQAMAAKLGAAIVEYSLGERRSYVFAVTPSGGIVMRALPGRKVIEKRIQDLRAALAQPPAEGKVESYRPPARELYNMLLEPVVRAVGKTDKLVIVPDGYLYYLPFEALMAERFLVENHTIDYAPSASVLAAISRENREARGFDLLAYGDPVFSQTQASGVAAQPDVVRSVYRKAGVSLMPLPNSRREVNEIAALFAPSRRRVFLGAEATKASLERQTLTDFRIVHFATHSWIDERSPGLSGIVLSMAGAGAQDGVLRAGEIFDLKLNADLTVLSACQTGLGKVVRGEGMVGLTRAFLYAGSTRVAVSLWNVNDLTTADFMKAFYQQMRADAAPAAALRQAKLEFLHSARMALRHPYYWAPFVMIGEW
jgi:CHAT domain-containing protein